TFISLINRQEHFRLVAISQHPVVNYLDRISFKLGWTGLNVRFRTYKAREYEMRSEEMYITFILSDKVGVYK
ncbi:hypothetical protein Avbf_18871, partial [Armadillidium vulgare]